MAIDMMLQILRNWAWLQRTQWMEKQQLAEIQRGKLKAILSHAYANVPFYRHMFQASGLSAIDEIDHNQIARLPAVTKGVYRATPLQERVATGTDAGSCMLLTTSGTSSQAVTVLEDPYSAAYREALNMRLLWAYGVRPRDKICRVRLGVKPELTLTLAGRKGAWRYVRNRFSKTMLSVGEMKEHMDFYSKWKPSVLFASGSYCRALMDTCETLGRYLTFKVVITTAEMSTKSTTQRVQNEFNAQVYDHYGIEEVGSIAWECPTHVGHHINSDCLLVELLKNGKSVNAYNEGELYVTSFHSIATPIIRYPTGDTASRSDDDCSCGRGLTLLSNIHGRILDYVLTVDGHYVSPMAVIGVLDKIGGLTNFKVTQQRDYTIEVIAVTRCESDEVVQNMKQNLRPLFLGTPINIKVVDRIEQPSDHKFRIVESKLTGPSG